MKRAGFTIIELMIASALMGVMMIFTLQTFTVSNRAYIKIDAVVDTQQNVRVIASVLESDLRHAGMMVPEGAAVCAIDDDSGPDRIFLSDHGALDTRFSRWLIFVASTTTVSSSVRTSTDRSSVSPPSRAWRSRPRSGRTS